MTKNFQSNGALTCKHYSETTVQCDFRKQLNQMTTSNIFLSIVFLKKSL